MSPGDMFNGLSPPARVAAAVLPFVIAVLVRLLLGNNQLTRRLFLLSVLWFATNILMAPYSDGMRQGISDLRTLLP